MKEVVFAGGDSVVDCGRAIFVNQEPTNSLIVRLHIAPPVMLYKSPRASIIHIGRIPMLASETARKPESGTERRCP